VRQFGSISGWHDRCPSVYIASRYANRILSRNIFSTPGAAGRRPFEEPMRDIASDLTSPRLKELFFYWRAKKGERVAPSRSDIQPQEIKRLLPIIYLMDVVPEPQRFRFRLVGTGIVDYFGEEITGRYLDELELNLPMDELLDQYREAVRERRAFHRRWLYTKRDRRRLEYERIILPLSADGTAINMLLCAAAWKDIDATRAQFGVRHD
jgi:hypothetical protein